MPTTMTPKIPRDLREFLFSLLDHNVKFVVAGAYVLATLGRPPLAIDLLTSLTGLTFAEAWAGRREIEIDGRAVPFLGKAEFVKTKTATGRTKDKLDLELLREAGLLD